MELILQAIIGTSHWWKFLPLFSLYILYYFIFSIELKHVLFIRCMKKFKKYHFYYSKKVKFMNVRFHISPKMQKIINIIEFDEHWASIKNEVKTN